MANDTIGGQLYLQLVASGSANLKANVETINDLNVFPIPDGDTGENMYRTISGGIDLARDSAGTSLGNVAKALEDGMLVNARGNSGVILSQFFAGIARGLDGLESADAKTLAEAFKQGVKSAYKSVITPTEGTMLTVSREGAEYAAGRVKEESTIESYLTDLLVEMKKSLKHTPELLPVLKEAGVVDSGGAGLVCIIEGMLKALSGESIEEEEEIPVKTAATTLDFNKFDENSVMEYGYCTEFLLRLQRAKTDVENFSLAPVIEFLESVGDSIVAIKNGTIVKVHVHTMTPHKVLEFCQRYGEFLTIKIENMTLQHNETVGKEGVKREKKKERKKYALVTTAMGEGIKKTFYDLGADHVIDGGQTNNPSTEDFIKAFDEVNADCVFVLPNNGNIILAAKQAAGMYKNSLVKVIESRNLGEGYAVMSMLDYGADDPDTIAEQLAEAMQGVVTGMVSRATRDVQMNGITVNKSDFVGLSDKQMLFSDKDKADAILGLLEKLGVENHEIVILIYGSGVTDEEKSDVEGRIAKAYPRTEVYTIDGGQDVYDCFVILE
ncbi:MAG TPA: hypothetical protein DDW54_00710 [Clostridiales bacterium]|nr:hypothetical protein [Clostridiales bacterium]